LGYQAPFPLRLLATRGLTSLHIILLPSEFILDELSLKNLYSALAGDRRASADMSAVLSLTEFSCESTRGPHWSAL